MPSGLIVFVDTNVLIYADDTRDAAKRLRAREWLLLLWQQRAGRLSTQVLNEYYVNVTRKLGLAQGDARAKVRRFQLWQPWQIDHQTVETAWGVEARFGLSYWDSLIVAAAAQSGCTHLLSEDLQHGQQIDAVTILNPFRVAPNELESVA
ncbi:MAG: twitching motility protein PilT [Acidovorax sp. SCN 68-22]|jgi:predicted nucleic acid-binding protein|nr:PIN domain-containing protein [Simplicispira sp.]ODS70715.1 MAG: twitching motility protein PilT [Acidovorax sp. SCN 68-22]